MDASARARWCSSSWVAAVDVAGREQAEQVGVRVDLVAGIATDPVDPREREPDLGGERLGERDQPGRPGQADERPVDRQVGRGQLGRAHALLHGVGEVAQRLAAGLACLLAGPGPAAYAGHLEHQPRHRHVVHGVVVQGRHVHAPVGRAGREPLAHQHAERLPDGGAGHAHRLGERDLAERRAGPHLAVEQRPLELVGHAVDRGGVLEVQRLEPFHAHRLPDPHR